jgi:hypothetical protein
VILKIVLAGVVALALVGVALMLLVRALRHMVRAFWPH